MFDHKLLTFSPSDAAESLITVPCWESRRGSSAGLRSFSAFECPENRVWGWGVGRCSTWSKQSHSHVFVNEHVQKTSLSWIHPQREQRWHGLRLSFSSLGRWSDAQLSSTAAVLQNKSQRMEWKGSKALRLTTLLPLFHYLCKNSYVIGIYNRPIGLSFMKCVVVMMHFGIMIIIITIIIFLILFIGMSMKFNIHYRFFFKLLLNIETSEKSRWKIIGKLIYLIFGYCVYFLHVNKNTETFRTYIHFVKNIGLILMTSVFPFHNAWGHALATFSITGNRKCCFFFSQKTLLLQHNKLAMAANVGDTNHETDKLELYPLFSCHNV